MTYEELLDFIENRMQMSHVYQPVMIMKLLEAGGVAGEEVIGRELLSHDLSQIEYYTTITRNMVGRVLRGHRIVGRDRKSKSYRLIGYEGYSRQEIASLRGACLKRLGDFVERRGEAIWSHRQKSRGYIPGTLRYEVLKAAGFHCDLCGVPADEKALEVDHIVPRNLGGSNERENLQALCYSCNATKRDRDDTDFGAVRESFEARVEGCPFCDLAEDRIVEANGLAVAIRDQYPVTEQHTLVIPARHVVDYFDLFQSELNACRRLLSSQRARIREADDKVRGFNVGINSGEVAGQTVMHCHIHLIPRREGDVAQPRGGVRNVIPGMGDYIGQ